MNFEFETDPVDEQVEVRKGRAFRGLATPMLKQSCGLATSAITNRYDEARPAIHTQQEAFHPAFRGLATPDTQGTSD